MRLLILISFLFLVGCNESPSDKYDEIRKTNKLLKNVRTEGLLVTEWPNKERLTETEEQIPENIIKTSKKSFKDTYSQYSDSLVTDDLENIQVQKIGHIKLADDLRAYQIIVLDTNTHFGTLFSGVYNHDWFNHTEHTFQALSADFQAGIISGGVKNDTTNLKFRYQNNGEPENYFSSHFHLAKEGIFWVGAEIYKKEKVSDANN